MDATINSGLICLRNLSANLKRDINFDALLTPEMEARLEKDPVDGLLALAAKLQLSPESHRDPVSLSETYTGPALLQLSNGNWICMVNLGQINDQAATIFDPLAQNNPMLSVPTEQLRSRLAGPLLIFRSLQPVDNRKQSALFALVAIARHHDVKLDIRRLMHDYAVGETEVSERQLLEIAGEHNLKTKKIKLKWSDLPKMGQAFPFIGYKKDGTCHVICGVRENEDEQREVILVDPVWQAEHPGQQFQFMPQKEFEAVTAGRGVLLKRNYKLADEDQPFGLRWFIPEFLKLKGLFGQIAVAVLMINVIALITPLFFQIVVDKVLVNETYVTLNVLGVAIVAAILFNALLEYLRNYLLLFATNKIDVSTATKTFKHLMRLPIEFFERVPSGVLLKHMQQTERIRGFLSGNLFFTVLEMFSLVVFVPFLLFYSWQLTLIVMGYSVLMALVIATLIKPFQIRLNELYQAEGKRQSMLVESIHGIRTVKSLAIEPVEEKQWNDSTAYAVKSYFKVGKISMTARTISQMLEMLMTVTVIWVGALLVGDKSQQFSIGALIAFQMLSGRVTGPLVRLVGLIHEYQQVALSVKMLGVVMNTPQEPPGGGVRNPLKGNIEFDNVTFQYRPDSPQVIRNFSLDIPVGSTVGIVGRSGSGKTTLTKLLQGLYPVQSGLIKIDGIDIREIDKAHLRSSIGVVLQENYFFNGTVRDNICLTKRDASLEEIIYATRLAGAHEFVSNLPKGYDTVLEENASNLSGGQKQRLAIARALLTNPSILIFDEATSALDPESENIIQENLAAIARGRTVLIISHRLSIVSSADMILVIDKGERTDYAPHRELLSHDGIYRDFWRQQMERNLNK